jgi:FAD/FMN-containing dehydrogenase
METVYTLLEANGLDSGLWGHMGEGSLHVQPRFNLAQVGDRQKAFKILDEFHRLVIGLGGTISSEVGDGRLRTPYLEAQVGAEAYELLHKIKQIFDPYGTLNPGVKFGTSLEDIKAAVRGDYGFDHLYDHLPRS